jgi:hypothetical protein
VVHPPPPPVRQESPPQVLRASPLSSLPPTVKKCQSSLPLFASTPKIGPRYGHSPPCEPMITLSFTSSGAPMKPTVSFSESTSLVSHFSSPVFMSIATSLPSRVPM